MHFTILQFFIVCRVPPTWDSRRSLVTNRRKPVVDIDVITAHCANTAKGTFCTIIEFFDVLKLLPFEVVNRKKSNCHDRLPVFINCKPVYYTKQFRNSRVKTRRINSRSISLSRQNNVDISSIWTISNGLYNNNIVYIIWSILHGAFDLLVIDYYCRSMVFQIFLANSLPVEIVSQLRWECMNKSLCRIRSKNQLILSDAHMNFEVSKPSNLSETTIELTPEQ